MNSSEIIADGVSKIALEMFKKHGDIDIDKLYQIHSTLSSLCSKNTQPSQLHYEFYKEGEIYTACICLPTPNVIKHLFESSLYKQKTSDDSESDKANLDAIAKDFDRHIKVFVRKKHGGYDIPEAYK
ncbi:hypothetical protein HGT70_04695 [Rosenbergiella collisarenosi]|uniref:hypothetical protein n=1 Tax=Rosenbergiella collisarenosi TaxID=1544695 RepID=UPI001BD98541|nr:hypothetical protein [Rosenbergiella collisarenosi]MBT0720582.1 hypothetical protein [Rosenbergiella collisarenosi]